MHYLVEAEDDAEPLPDASVVVDLSLVEDSLAFDCVGKCCIEEIHHRLQLVAALEHEFFVVELGCEGEAQLLGAQELRGGLHLDCFGCFECLQWSILTDHSMVRWCTHYYSLSI